MFLVCAVRANRVIFSATSATEQATVSGISSGRRMSRSERRKNIIDHAVAYFADCGFYADTRALAERIGVTQAILYKHFPSKDAMIAAVFERLTEQQDVSAWEGTIRNGGEALLVRLSRFFHEYASTTYTYQWIRIHMHASLYGGQFNRQFIKNVTGPILRLIAEEIRREMKFPADMIGDTSVMEIEILWIFHYGLYYHPFRQHVYGLQQSVDFSELIREALPGTLFAVESHLREKYPEVPVKRLELKKLQASVA